MQWAIADSNCGLSACKADTLTAELIARKVMSDHHPQKTLSAIFTALEGSDKRKHQTLFFLFSGRHPNGVGDLARVYTSKVCPAFSVTSGGDQIPDLSKLRI